MRTEQCQTCGTRSGPLRCRDLELDRDAAAMTGRIEPTRGAETRPLLLLILLLLQDPVQAQPHAELVARGATVLTMDNTQPIAQGFAITGAEFLAVGSDAQLSALIGPATRVLDLSGKVVLPGLIDAHLHPVPSYPPGHWLHQVDLRAATTPDMAVLINRISSQASQRDDGDWIIGIGYEDTALGRHPDRADLDRASNRHPIYITHSSGHRAVASSLALELAGLNEDVADPPGGGFMRNEDGTLNGQLLETAMAPLREAQDLTPTPEDLLTGVETTLRRFSQDGLTSVVDATPYPEAWLYPAYASLRQAGRLPVRVVAMVPYDMLHRFDPANHRQDDWLSIGPVKLFHGNSLSGRTAWLSKPYVGRPDDFGIPPARSQSDLNAVVHTIDARGMQAAIHSNGDREIDMVLTAYEKLAAAATVDGARHRIEHASIMNPALLERARKLHLVLALHSYIYEHGDKMEDYGPQRWEWMHANRSATELGIAVAGNSDYPVSAAEPLLRFRSLLTRRSSSGKVYGASQRIDFMTALETFTLGAAYSIFREASIGSIQPGKLADFVILNRDPRNVPPQALADVEVVSTWIGGRQVEWDSAVQLTSP